MSATTPQNQSSFEELFKHVDTVPLALFEHLDLSFLEEFPVFAPDPRGRTQGRGVHKIYEKYQTQHRGSDARFQAGLLIFNREQGVPLSLFCR